MLHSDMETVDFVELYERTLDEVYRYASRVAGGDRIRTDELVQETYLSVMRRLRNDEAPIEPNLAYLLVTCRSRFLDQLRSERRRRIREERVARSDAAVAPIDPSDLDPGRITRELGELPDAQRAALVLRYVDDLEVADVAEHLGRSVRATESLLARARTALRTAFHEGTTS